ncbi:MAG: hypothetical protein ACI841_000064 [Planctomycetota bacterium]|jgi:hypothetical protein
MTDRDLAKYWISMIYQSKLATRPKQFPSTSLILEIVKRKKGSIAIADVANLPERHGLKVVTVHGKKPGDPKYALVAENNTSSGGLDAEQESEFDAEVQESNFRSELALPVGRLNNDEDADRIDQLEQTVADLQIALFVDEVEHNFMNSPLLDLSGFGHTASRWTTRVIATRTPTRTSRTAA